MLVLWTVKRHCLLTYYVWADQGFLGGWEEVALLHMSVQHVQHKYSNSTLSHAHMHLLFEVVTPRWHQQNLQTVWIHQ